VLNAYAKFDGGVFEPGVPRDIRPAFYGKLSHAGLVKGPLTPWRFRPRTFVMAERCADLYVVSLVVGGAELLAADDVPLAVLVSDDEGAVIDMPMLEVGGEIVLGLEHRGLGSRRYSELRLIGYAP
jgi:hypothetical protein